MKIYICSLCFWCVLMASIIEGWCFCLWGVTYDGNYLDTNILDLSCPVDVTMTKFQSKLFDKMDPFKTCCVATGSKSQLLEHEVAKTRGIGWEPTVDEAYNNKFMIYQYVDQCEITREYIPSAMEQRHVDVAFTHSNRDEALKSIRAYISRDDQRDVLAEVEMSVKKRMQTDEFLDGNEDELGYLSYFKYSKTCQPLPVFNKHGFPTGKFTEGIAEVSWVEYIEPLLLHNYLPDPKATGFGRPMNHVLLQSGKDELKRSFIAGGKHKKIAVKNMNKHKLELGYSNTTNLIKTDYRRVPKHYLFVTGSSGSTSYTNTLYYFMCGYSQRRISFDQAFVWEHSLVDPMKFWMELPVKWKSHVTLYNSVSPYAASPHGTELGTGNPLPHRVWNDPLDFIRRHVAEYDFVALKMDINYQVYNAADTAEKIDAVLVPEELPGALVEILENRDHVASLIDEIFFEVNIDDATKHQHPVYGEIGFDLPYVTYSEAVLKHNSYLQVFHDLRKLGIRAHIIPPPSQ